MLRIALRDTRMNPARFAMSVLAVLLATAFVGATFSFTNMLSGSLARITESATVADRYIRGVQIATPDQEFGPPQRELLQASVVEEVRAVEGVAAAAPVLFGAAILVDGEGRAVANGAAPSLGRVLHPGIDEFEILAGRLPHPDALREIALDRQTLALSGFQLGDTATVTFGDSAPTAALIVGEVDTGPTFMGATFVFPSEATGLAAFAPSGVVSRIAVSLSDGANPAHVTTLLEAALGEKAEVITGSQLREESKSATAEAMGFIEVFMLVFAFIAFFVGSFLVANTFAILVRQRQREFALLRAIGASPSQVLVSLLVQAGIVATIGAVLGIGAGVLLVMGAQQVFAALGSPIAGNPWLPWDRAALIVLAAVVFTGIASLVPARAAALTPPLDAMRPESPKPERSLFVRATLAALLTVAGGVVLWFALRDADALLTGIAAALILVGVLGLGPMIVPPVLGSLALPFQLLRPVGRLARGNVLRSPRRTSATAAALSIGMTFVSATAVLAASATASTSAILENQMTADFFVGSQRSLFPAALEPEIEQLDSVSSLTPVQFGFIQSVDPAGTMTVSAMSLDGYEQMLNVPIIAGTALAHPDEILISQGFWKDTGTQVGDTLMFNVAGSGEVARRVVGVTNDSFMLTDAYALTDGLQDLIPNQARSTMFLLLNSAGDLDQTRADLEAVLADLPVLAVLDQEQLADQMNTTIASMMNILYALLGLSLVIAVLSIINTLAMAVMERTREIGLLRAVGLGGGQLVGMIVVESVLTALFGALTGAALGVGLGATLPAILGDMGLTELAIPWQTLALILAGTLAAGVVAALWPAWRALRQPILQAVAGE